MEIPDGASIYGVSFNGAHGENVEMSNIKISDIQLNVNEIPAPYFDQCIDPQTNIRQILTGPFGDVMDLRRMVGEFRNGQVIDLGDDITQLCYVGNPLSDAQIALGLQIYFDYVYKDELPNKSSIQIKQLAPGHEITFALLAELIVDQKYGYPNNFYACNIKNEGEIVPYPPNGIDKVWCADYVSDEIDAVIGKVLPVDVNVDAEANDNHNHNVAANADVNSINNIAIELKKLNNPNDDVLIQNNNKHVNIIDKYPNTPYVYFVIGLICIIMVVFVLVTFIMRCGKIMMNQIPVEKNQIPVEKNQITVKKHQIILIQQHVYYGIIGMVKKWF